MEEFTRQTINPKLFEIQNVPDDNACFYRSIANYMYYATPHSNITMLKRFYGWGKTKDIISVINIMKPYSNEQNELAEFIQSKICKYIREHSYKILPQTGMSIEKSIELIHEITLGEYLSYYGVFAGDIDMNQDLEDEDYYVDRWGSIIEQYVVSRIIEAPVIVLNSQKYDTVYNKISNGKIVNNRANKDVRFRITAIIGEEYIGKKLPIFIVWREYYKKGHYMSIFPKNPSTILEDINL